MDSVLYKLDIFPKVVSVGKTHKITIAPIGASYAFKPGKDYNIRVQPVDEGNHDHYPSRPNNFYFPVTANDRGELVFEFDFFEETLHFVKIYDGDKRLYRLMIYAVEGELIGKYPFIGDMHMHTFRSDGGQSPAVVAANYRQYGYDFLAITDHGRYYPSLEAMKAFKGVKTEYLLVPGEEVHLSRPGVTCDPHIVNFGGEFSINALIEGSDHLKDVGAAKTKRATRKNDVPDVLSVDEFKELITEKAKSVDRENPEEREAYAVMQWIFDKIRDANGLGIFAHPYWFNNARQLPETFLEFIMDKHEFDAFEVLGGENYFEHNGFQTIRYYEDKAKGRNYPIVGSTDSHSSLSENRNYNVCETMVFTEKLTRENVIKAVKDYMSVAVDTISRETRFVGDMRLVRYACFLKDNFFPLHDELCHEEGRALRRYACGDEYEADVLAAIYGRMKRQREKYFEF